RTGSIPVARSRRWRNISTEPGGSGAGRMARLVSLMGVTVFMARRNNWASSRLSAGSAVLVVLVVFRAVGGEAAGAAAAWAAATLRRRFRSANPLADSPWRPPLFARI